MTMEEKLEQAKMFLGVRYILHPRYERADNPAHSYPESWFMRRVQEAALKHGSKENALS